MAKRMSVPLSKTQRIELIFEEAQKEKIRQRAYELYEQRRREDGHDVEDWLKAESEITGKAKAMAT